MGPEALAYPFIFIAIFFESFILVTLLSEPARVARRRGTHPIAHSGILPSIAVIVPCLNEGSTVAKTARSLLALDYPKEKLQIILVDNGSTDETPHVMQEFKNEPQVRILTVHERGKHVAVNAGIATTDAEFIGCLDADSFVDPHALREIIPCFVHPRVAAVTAAMSVHKPQNVLQHMQNAEYIFGISLRHAIASLNGLYVTPGPFSFYRRSVIESLGGFRSGHQTEDMEMALRIQRAGYHIENAPRARVYTNAPSSVSKLIKQRTRWTTGFLRNVLGEYRDLIGNPRHETLGVLMLPAALIAVGSGILIFFLMLSSVIQNIITTIEIRAGIPLSYALLPHGTFEWFYFPTNLFVFLGFITLSASLFLIIVGKRLSGTPGSIALGMFSYSILYGLIAPLWLIRATADVTFGKERSWRTPLGNN